MRIAAVLALGMLACGVPRARPMHPIDASLKLRAPELTGGVAWLNTDRPLTLKALRGHVVVLDFWTLGCINCLHTIPELERVERDFAGQPVVVIGVHSGKFAAEKDAARIREALGRYGVSHPVVVDSAFTIWNAYAVSAWPTVVVIDPDGRIAWADAGEPAPGFLTTLVGQRVAAARAAGTLAAHRVVIHTPAVADTGPLSYPGKVAVARDGRIAIADSNHHRIVVVDALGHALAIAGSGIQGHRDGSLAMAGFRRPQGVAFGGAEDQLIYVADTDNHELRLIDLAAGTVTTIAGTGKKAEGLAVAGGPAGTVDLRSPWDLALERTAAGERLYVAMAGSHQIWLYDATQRTMQPFAGSGIEDVMDADESLRLAAFAQPSGLSLAGRKLYVADAEASAVRVIDLDRGTVATLAGEGLFEFGDRDGVGDEVRLQHVAAVAGDAAGTYLADTYNDKIKRIDAKSRQTRTVAGGGGALAGPAGLAWLPDGRLLIADTDHHRLRTLDPRSGALAAFPLSGVPAPPLGLVMAESGGPAAAPLALQTVRASGRLGPGAGTLLLQLTAPPGATLTAGAPLLVELHAPGVTAAALSTELDPAALPLHLALTIAPGAHGPLDVTLSYFWCSHGDHASCVPERVHLQVELDLSGPPGGTATLHYPPR